MNLLLHALMLKKELFTNSIFLKPFCGFVMQLITKATNYNGAEKDNDMIEK